MSEQEQPKFVARLDDSIEMTVADDIEMSSCEVCGQLARLGWTGHGRGLDAASTSHMISLCSQCGAAAVTNDLTTLLSRLDPRAPYARYKDLIRQLCSEPAVVFVLGSQG